MAFVPRPSCAASNSNSCQYYKVQAGDTLSTIAASLGLTTLDLQDANPDLNPTALAPNSFVKLPGWWVLAAGGGRRHAVAWPHMLICRAAGWRCLAAP